jgi:hypothetical protein
MDKISKELQPNEDFPLKVVQEFIPLQQDSNGSPLSKISEVLQNQGVSKMHLREAIAILIGIMSAKLGDPVPMIVTEDEGAGALELLHTCLNLVPADSWIEAPTGKGSGNGANHFAGKTIISYEADASKDLFLRLLTETELKNKLTETKKRSIPGELSSSSFVAITKNHHNPLFQNRYVTRIHISADQESKSKRLEILAKKSDLESQKHHKIESACLQTLFDRIKAQPVDIWFADKIINKHALNIQNVVPFYDAMFRILKNIARINSSPPLRPEELEAAFIGLGLDELTADDTINENEPIKATKVDYYYFLLIFREMFNVKNDFLTQRQLAIYHAILGQNITYKKRSTSYSKLTEQQILDTYRVSGFNKGWATRTDIMASLKAEGFEDFSYPTLHNELQVLSEQDLIKETKVPRRKNKSAYAATQYINDASLFLINPDDIVDPDSEKQLVEVYNFLSGETEKI